MASTFHELPAAAQTLQPRPMQQTRSRVPIYLFVSLAYLLFIPEQFNFTVIGLYLPPYRIFMFGAALYLLSRSVAGSLRFYWPDLFVILATAWIWLAAYMTSGEISTTLLMGGSHTIDIALAYFLARATIRTPRDFRLFLILIVPGFAAISAIVAQEAVTHIRLLQPIASEITGIPNRLRDEVRLGFMRGAGPFPHPILAGLFLASFLPLYLASGLRGWPKILGIAASIAGFFSMSSAALLGLMVGGILWLYDWLTERVWNVTWRLFLMFSSALYMTVELVTSTGFYGLMVRYASLNTATAYSRVLIWNFGTENIARNPWFGLGYSDWDRPSWMHSGSIDHFWLIMALRFGIPASAFLIIATVGAVLLLAIKSQTYRPEDARLLRGLAISVSVFALGAISVSLWLSVMVWFFMLVGIAVSLSINLERDLPPGMRYRRVRRAPPPSDPATPAVRPSAQSR